MTPKTSRAKARAWWRANVPRPWICICGDEVRDIARGIGVIHHVDEDPLNNDPSNLRVMHMSCHMRHHNTGRGFTQDHARKLGMSRRGKLASVETRQRLREAWVRRKANTQPKKEKVH